MDLKPLIAAPASVPRAAELVGDFSESVEHRGCAPVGAATDVSAFPWPHLYEHPINIANFTIERRHQNEGCRLLRCKCAARSARR